MILKWNILKDWLLQVSTKWKIFKLTDEEYKIYITNRHDIYIVDWKIDFRINSEKEAYENEQEVKIRKGKKREAILAIASETDQMNLIASVLDTITSESPDPLIIADAKAKFNEIKAILNS